MVYLQYNKTYALNGCPDIEATVSCLDDLFLFC